MDDRTTINEDNSFNIKVSRNGLPIPIIEGIHLHSVYNPAKEAEAFSEKHKDTLKRNNHILILGLGFGYHIDQVEEFLSQEHEHFNILVLEPNSKIVESFKQHRAFKSSHITILNPNNVNHLFESADFINFLRQKPAIIKHDPSFNLEKVFYTRFLKYKAPKNIENYIEKLSDILQMYLTDFHDLSRPFKSIASEVKEKRGLQNKFDFGILALDALINKSHNDGVKNE